MLDYKKNSLKKSALSLSFIASFLFDYEKNFLKKSALSLSFIAELIYFCLIMRIILLKKVLCIFLFFVYIGDRNLAREIWQEKF